MKLDTGRYMCGWCGIVLDHQRRTVNMNNRMDKPNIPGRHTVTSVLKCPHCNNAISQRTKGGLR